MILPILQLDRVSKSFGGVQALRNVSFDLKPAEVHALLGENGAGKSTLIKIITGAHQPDAGTIEISGQKIRHLTPRTAHNLGIACIYQQPALFADLTVAENIALRLEPVAPARRIDWAGRRLRAKQLLDRVGAAIHIDAEVRELSMPEQQLVEISCAIGAGARIIIMDEPTASLTQQEQHRLYAIVRELRGLGVGLIYISHRLEEIFALADRVTVLRDGESVGTFPVNTAAPASDSSNVCARPSEHEPALAGAKDTGGLPIHEAALIHLMVGREVSLVYPPREGSRGGVLLSTRKLGCRASGVRDVSLDLQAGEVVGLAGLVGAGRTELARILFGITAADGGEILLEGKPVSIDSPQAAISSGIAYVPEDRRRHGIILELPIAANMTMAIHEQVFPGSWLRFSREAELADQFIRKLDVRAPGPDALGATLSGGNQQKVALARWLACKPKVLILDEPTQGVDVGAKTEIHKIIRALAQEGLAVLMISSDLPEIIGMSDRILVMRKGTLVAGLPGGSDPQQVMAAALGQRTMDPDEP